MRRESCPFGLFLAGAVGLAAQWYVGAYLGVNHTRSVDVSIVMPADGLALVYRDVRFAGEPFR